MRATFHPDFYTDLAAATRHYRQKAGLEVARDFYFELRKRIEEATTNPETFAVRVNDLRRVNLRRFQYHFCSVSPAIQSASLSCVIIASILHLV